MGDTANDDPSFISTLPEPLRGYALQAFSNNNDDDNDEGKRLDQLEISTRSHLLELVEPLLLQCGQQDETTTTSSSVETLLQYLKNVTLLCHHVVQDSTTNNSAIKKLPFLLLEDAIDSLPLVHIQSLWSSPLYPTINISSYTTKLLCSPVIFVTPSKFVLLRICNKLLKILSNRDVDAEFAGSLMMMMARVFPLSERSAVNVLGSFNVNNETAFEDEEEFVARGKLKGEEEDGSGSGNNGSIGYDFYKTFWGVQRVFTDPQGTILSSRGGLTQAQAAAGYNSFMKDVTSILVALESTPIPKSASSASSALSRLDNETSSSTANNSSSGSSSSDNIVRHHKYLTNSQLLHLQLKDAKLRIHFLTQLIIILSYLNSPIGNNVALPTPPITPAPGSDPTKLLAQIKNTQMKQLEGLEKRTWELLRATEEGVAGGGEAGESMYKSLRWILRDRETMWKLWKRGRCMPAMDKVGGSTVGVGGTDVGRLLLSGKKRKKMGEDASSSGGIAQITKDDLLVSQQTSFVQPQVTSFLQPYVEALDPENGIEGEYHPRNDSVYSWRALRLMARDQGGDGGEGGGYLARFGKLRRRDGDFEGVVRGVYEDGGEEIGGSMDEHYYDEENEEEEVVNDDSAKVNGDVEMDDASVGTPEEESEARKEKMAEFERAAMEVEEEMLNDDDDGAGEAKDGEEDAVKKEEGGDEDKDAADDDKAAEPTVKEEDAADSSIRNAAAETIESMFNEEPKKTRAAAKKEESSVKEESKTSSKGGTGTQKSKGGQSKSDNGAEKKGNEAAKDNGNKKDEKTGASAKAINGKKKEEEQSKRAKFTPKAQVRNEPARDSKKNEQSRDNSRGRYDGRGRGRNNASDQQQQQQQQQSSDRNRDNSADGGRRGGGGGRNSRIPPPQNQRGDGPKRDGRSRSPPNAPPAGHAPRGGAGRGNWEPPHGGRGGRGDGPGGPGGRGGGGGRGNYRERSSSRRGGGRR